MTSWTDRLLAALRLRHRKPEAGVSPDQARRGPGPAETASLGTTSGPQEPSARPAHSPGGDRRPSRPPASDDVTSVIAPQHEHITTLLEAVRRQTGHRRAAAFHTLRLTLALHETAEEQAIHPQALRQLGAHDRAASDRIAEEQTAGQTIGSLELVDVDSDQFNVTFGHLATSVTDHAEAEESDEWPALQKITDPPVINAMVEQMQAVTQLAADPSAPGIRVTFSEMQDWAKAHLPTPPAS
jgi:hemerythrin superfamily protein